MREKYVRKVRKMTEEKGAEFVSYEQLPMFYVLPHVSSLFLLLYGSSLSRKLAEFVSTLHCQHTPVYS